MISVNATYNTIIGNGGHYEWRITNGNNTFTKDNIVSGTITTTLYNNVSVGNALSAELDLTLRNATIDTNLPLQVGFRATNGSSNSVWYSKGTYFIDTVDTSPYSDITEITAFDAMLKAETVYQEEGTWTPKTDAVVLQNIATDLGVMVGTNAATVFGNNPITLTNPPNIGEYGTTDREMLEYFGAMRGGNWIISHGALEFIPLNTSPTYTANVGDAVVSFTASNAEVVKRVRLIVGAETIYAYPPVPLQTHTPEDITDHNNEAILAWAASALDSWNEIGGKLIDANVPFWGDYALGDTLYNQLKNTSIIPYKAETAYLDPKYEIGDGITIKNTTSIIANVVNYINPLATCDLEISAEERLNSLYPFLSSKTRTDNYNAWNTIRIITGNLLKTEANAEAIANVPAQIEGAVTNLNADYILSGTLNANNVSTKSLGATESISGGTYFSEFTSGGIKYGFEGGLEDGTTFQIKQGRTNQGGLVSNRAKLQNSDTGAEITLIEVPSTSVTEIDLDATYIVADGALSVTGDLTVDGNISGSVNGTITQTTLINSGASKTFTVPNASRHFIVVSGTVTARQAAYIVGCSTTGAVDVTNLAQGSSITSSTGTNSFTIGTSGGSASVMITTFSGDPVTFS